MIKSNRFYCQHFHFPGILIFMLWSAAVTHWPQTAALCSRLSNCKVNAPHSLQMKEGTQIFVTGGLVVGVLPQQPSTGFLVLHPYVPKQKVLPWGKHFGACEERKGFTGGFPAGKPLSAGGGSCGVSCVQ